MDKPTLHFPATLAPKPQDLPAAAPAIGASADIETPTRTDRLLHAALGRLTAGISPAALALAWTDLLEAAGSGRVAPPAIGAPARGYAPLGAAPGNYVLER